MIYKVDIKGMDRYIMVKVWNGLVIAGSTDIHQHVGKPIGPLYREWLYAGHKVFITNEKDITANWDKCASVLQLANYQ